MRAACDEAGVALVTGDTKVVDRGKGDQIFITTSGIGLVPDGRRLSVRNARPGDRVLVSGTIGDHGIAIMSVREGIEFETVLESDTAPLAGLTRAMLEACPRHPLDARPDPRRRVQRAQRIGRRLPAWACGSTKAAIPVRAEVQAACEMLGLDPALCGQRGQAGGRRRRRRSADRLLDVMRDHPLGRNAAVDRRNRRTTIPAWSSCDRVDRAASAWSRCWPANNCRGFVESLPIM